MSPEARDHPAIAIVVERMNTGLYYSRILNPRRLPTIGREAVVRPDVVIQPRAGAARDGRLHIDPRALVWAGERLLTAPRAAVRDVQTLVIFGVWEKLNADRAGGVTRRKIFHDFSGSRAVRIGKRHHRTGGVEVRRVVVTDRVARDCEVLSVVDAMIGSWEVEVVDVSAACCGYCDVGKG